ncbi:GFA family protein [Pseudomonadota bacterium]
MQIDGTCHCGNITFSGEVDPEKVIICHCTDCQTLSGSAYRTVAPAIEGTFKLLSGEPRIYVKTSESGSRRAQAFCPDCGTPIYSAPEGGGSTFFGLRVGAIRQRDQLMPRSQCWSRSAQTWVQDISKLPKV